MEKIVLGLLIGLFLSHANAETKQCEKADWYFSKMKEFPDGRPLDIFHNNYGFDIEDVKTMEDAEIYVKGLCAQSHRPGVKIGMTAKQVVENTSWGKPDAINKTTNKNGTHEQWVYGDRNYLYFDNGKLTSYQN